MHGKRLDPQGFLGEEARETGLIGRTTVFNFKPAFGAGDKEFSVDKKYWVSEPSEEKPHIETLSAKDAGLHFLRVLFAKIRRPEKVIVGEPAIRAQAWKENFRRHMREVFEEIGINQIDFFPEPFAVYQYYRHAAKILPLAKEAEIVLIIDIGGGTFNSCIIRTTNQGQLARAGATSVPLGLQADMCGGSEIDLDLLKIVIAKAKRKRIAWKEDPIAWIQSKRTPALLRIEDAKIRLSENISKYPAARLADDFSNIAVTLTLPKGECHPDLTIEEILTGEDLKSVIREMWRRKYGKIIFDTINEAKDRLKSSMNLSLDRIDKVLLAGGSSRLPFMKEEIHTALPTYIHDKNNIFIGSDIDEAVAYGIACECREQANREPQLSIGKIGPCILNDLYLGVRTRRKDLVQVPRIKYKGVFLKDGQLLSAPFETEEATLKYEVEMPFDISERLFYVFTDKPILEDEDVLPINLDHDVISVPHSAKLLRKCELHLEIKSSGLIKPVFRFRGKGASTSKKWQEEKGSEFYFPDFQIKEGNAYVGIDFGTSNSYLVKFLSIPQEKSGEQYPVLTISSRTKDRLRSLELRINEFRNKGCFLKANLIEHARKHALEAVFHSNKIEGNPLTKGETQTALLQLNRSQLSAKELEAKNLETAYYWMLEHFESFFEQPESFIREINSLIVKDLRQDGGQYRNSSVTLSGADFVPPQAYTVPAFMQQLSREIRNGAIDRSPLEFASTIHTKFVWIHPFNDGNGRTARILLNACLLAHGLPVIVVNFADRERYIYCLNESNKGDLSSMVEFFVECFEQQLEDFRLPESVTAPAETKAEKTPAITPLVLQSEIATIDRAIREVGLEETENPLVSVMQQKLLEENKIREARYEAWKQSLLTIPAEFKAIIESFNSNQDYRTAGYRIKMQEYDLLTQDKYEDIGAGKGATKTWFLGLEISGPNSRERVLFFFSHASSKITEDVKSSKVGLVASRFDGSRYQRLGSEPISLREIGYRDGQLLFLSRDGVISSKNVRQTLTLFLAEIIKSYIS